MAELVCPLHGPYDASLGQCPICSGGLQRPVAPHPLDEEDMPTDIGARPLPNQGRWGGDDEGPTEIGPSRRNNARFLDLDSEEVTELGRVHVQDDVTELEFEKDTGPQAILWVKEGNRRGRVYKVTNETIIGRRDATLILDDPKVSSIHAKFTFEDDQFVLWDFGSKNGTFVNGERIRAATALKENDVIKIGDTVFVLKVLD